MNRKFFAVLLSLYILSSFQTAEGKELLITNSSFESGSNSSIEGWKKDVYYNEAGVSEFIIDETVAKTGTKSILISNNLENDSRIYQEIKVKEGYYYKISCYVKTEKIGTDGKGANISGFGLIAASNDVKGTTTGWEYLEITGKAAKGQESFVLTLGIGGYGSMNIGKAWFDNVTVEELEVLPQGVKAISLANENGNLSNQSSNEQKNDINDVLLNIYVFSFMFLAAIIFVFIFITVMKQKRNNGQRSWILYILVIFGLVMRIVIAGYVEGYETDINCFKAWSTIISNNFISIYDGSVFMDYPPGIVYVLMLPGLIVKFLNLYTKPWIYSMVIKLPAIAADILTAIILFKISKKRLKYNMALLIAAIYLFNPAIIINSVVWGQVDSILVLLVVCATYLLYIDKLELSAVLFAAAVMVKPQGIILLPVLLFELIRKGKIGRLIVSMIYGVVSAILIALPFGYNKEPLWIFNLFLKTASGYKGASVNAFNLFGLLGANWKPDASRLLIFNYFTWGMIFIVLITAFVLFIYLKGKNAFNPSIAAAILVVGVFTFSSRMHERYMFPAIALLLMAYVLLNDIRFMRMYAIASITVFSNTWVVFALSLHNNYWVPANSVVMKIVGLVNILLFIYLVKVSLSLTEFKVKRAAAKQ